MMLPISVRRVLSPVPTATDTKRGSWWRGAVVGALVAALVAALKLPPGVAEALTQAVCSVVGC